MVRKVGKIDQLKAQFGRVTLQKRSVLRRAEIVIDSIDIRRRQARRQYRTNGLNGRFDRILYGCNDM